MIFYDDVSQSPCELLSVTSQSSDYQSRLVKFDDEVIRPLRTEKIHGVTLTFCLVNSQMLCMMERPFL